MNRDITYDEVLHRVENEDKDKPDRFLEGSSEEEWEDDEEEESEEEYGTTGQQQIMELIEKKQHQQDAIVIDWDQILEVLNKNLPEIP